MKPLTPSNPGNWLTQAKDVEPHQRIFTKCIYLGCGDSPENYREVTDDERLAVEELLTLTELTDGNETES